MEDSREGKEDDEKRRRMPNSHVDDEKGKKPWYIRGGKTEEKENEKRERKNTTGEEKENHISRACPKRLIARFHDRILNLFTLKSNILAQDQTSSFSRTLQIHCLGYMGQDPFLCWI